MSKEICDVHSALNVPKKNYSVMDLNRKNSRPRQAFAIIEKALLDAGVPLSEKRIVLKEPEAPKVIKLSENVRYNPSDFPKEKKALDAHLKLLFKDGWSVRQIVDHMQATVPDRALSDTRIFEIVNEKHYK